MQDPLPRIRARTRPASVSDRPTHSRLTKSGVMVWASRCMRAGASAARREDNSEGPLKGIIGRRKPRAAEPQQVRASQTAPAHRATTLSLTALSRLAPAAGHRVAPEAWLRTLRCASTPLTACAQRRCTRPREPRAGVRPTRRASTSSPEPNAARWWRATKWQATCALARRRSWQPCNSSARPSPLSRLVH